MACDNQKATELHYINAWLVEGNQNDWSHESIIIVYSTCSLRGARYIYAIP